MHNTINPELVSHVTTLIQAWNAADQRVRALFHGWEQRALRAGLERGFYLQLAQMPSADVLAGAQDDDEQAGRRIYEAYLRGAIANSLDTLTN